MNSHAFSFEETELLSIHSVDQFSIAFIIGVRDIPFSVNEYSMSTGVSG